MKNEPAKLSVGDNIRFFKFPDEWSDEKCSVLDEDRDFMSYLINNKIICEVDSVDDNGNPWVSVVSKECEIETHHSWAVAENSGWVRV